MKVLILSHCQIAEDFSIGKTLASLFSAFDKSELCQLYVHSGTPTIDVCNSYFSLTDKDVLKRLFFLGSGGRETKVSSYQNNNPKSTAFKRSKRNELLRDLLWRISPWYGSKLNDWINREKPSCVFVALGSGRFLYDMALKISKKHGIPIVAYVCDDFYFDKTADKGLVNKLWHKKLCKKTEQLFSKTKAIVSICPELSEVYANKFNRPTYTVMTGSTISRLKNRNRKARIENVRYFGKLSLDRYKSILDVGTTLDLINRSDKQSFSLDVFCGDVSREIKDLFKDVQSVRFHNFVRGEEFESEFYASDALLHIEGFEKSIIERVKYSISTKIADYLASGIPVFAYGPDGIASIAHLKRNQSAVIATQRDQLEPQLRELFYNTALTDSVSKRALETAEKNHNSRKVSESLYNVLSSVQP